MRQLGAVASLSLSLSLSPRAPRPSGQAAHPQEVGHRRGRAPCAAWSLARSGARSQLQLRVRLAAVGRVPAVALCCPGSGRRGVGFLQEEMV